MPDFRNSFTAREVCEGMLTEITVFCQVLNASFLQEKYSEIMKKYRALLIACRMYVIKWESSITDLWICEKLKHCCVFGNEDTGIVSWAWPELGHHKLSPALWGLCTYVIVHTVLPPSPVILRIELGGKPKWLPLNFGYHDAGSNLPGIASQFANQILGTANQLRNAEQKSANQKNHLRSDAIDASH